MRRDRTLGLRELEAETAPRLQGRSLERAMAGVTLLYNTVYGDPCTIVVRADGTLDGHAGYADEDRDTGRWWVEGDRWFRQWRSWAYAEAAGFITVVDDDQVRWFSKEGQLVDTALIVGAPRAARRRAAP
jgi:GntR family transcriptional regulator / MocR family aminotransferase